jgi:hypothetical protein
MFKIMGRVSIVLLAVGLIIGVTYAISQNGSFSLPSGGGSQFGEHNSTGLIPQDGSPDSSTDGQAQSDLSGAGGRHGATLQDGSDDGLTAGETDGVFRGAGSVDGGRGEHERGSAFGWSEVLKSLGIIALVTAAVIVLQKAYEWLRRLRKPAAPARSGV